MQVRADPAALRILDGPMGSELVRRGVRWRGHGMRTDQDAVRTLHQEYLAAGADVIRTNTFQLNRRTYLNVFRDAAHQRHIGAPGLEHRATDLLRTAVRLAREAREASGRSGVAIAGVMSPLEHCFRPDLAPADDAARAEHHEIAHLLADAGADLLLLESMNSLAEARVASEAAATTGRPVWVSFVVAEDGQVLGGDPLTEAARTVREAGAQIVLANCAPPADIERAISHLAASGGRWGAFAHVGRYDPPSWKLDFFPQFTDEDAWPPDRYAQAAQGWIESGAGVVGGCCGTGPDHVRALRALLGASA